MTVRNTGSAPLTRIVAVRGLPLTAPPASASHMTIAKAITAADGTPADLSHLVQNQRLVVHLSGGVDDDAYHQSMLVDPLPAGLEIESVVAKSAGAAGNGFPWLGDITDTRTAERRDDRFMAAIDLGRAEEETTEQDGRETTTVKRQRSFNVAYVVRVVSPGRFVLPAASIRDLYRPDVQARGAVGTVQIDPPAK